MGTEVYANGREICCKAASGSVTAAFPDVCLSPPSPPAGPVPLPYPITSMASDLTDGSKSVKIKGKPVCLEDKSSFKKCTGNEPATKSFGMGVVSHQINGKTYFVTHSPDVVVEGNCVTRHLDMTTSNHGSQPPNEAAPWPYLSGADLPAGYDCGPALAAHPVESYKDQEKKCGPNGKGVYNGCQSHHVIQNSHFQYPRGTTIKDICPGYSEGEAPCIPLTDGPKKEFSHGAVSAMQKADGKVYQDRFKANGSRPSYQQARADAKSQLTKPEPGPNLSPADAECILQEVDKKFAKMCGKGADTLALRPPGIRGTGIVEGAAKIAKGGVP